MLGGGLDIYSDSRYAINTLTTWGDKWELNNYERTSSGRLIANLDLIIPGREKIDEYNELYSGFTGRTDKGVQFFHVAGHSGNVGNEEADKLANLGADQFEY